MAITPLADRAFANDYFGDRLGTDEWDGASDATKDKSLRHATHLINQLNYIGFKTDSDQESEWPRLGETDVPVEVKQACSEVALELLRGHFLETEDNAVGKTSESVGDASVSYGDGGKDLYTENFGLPSRAAARLISKWLVNPRNLRLLRM